MTGASHLSGLVTACRLRFVVLLTLMFCAPSQAYFVTVTDNTLDMYPEAEGSPVVTVTSPAGPRKPLKEISAPDGIVSVGDRENSPAMALPESGTSIASGNRLLLFFLLLMSGIFGLLAEIATTRRQR